jgi:formylglycine-generating enzyme required for sulfatase activity
MSVMARWSLQASGVVVVACVIAMASSLVGCPSPTQSGPELLVASDTLDFGDTRESLPLVIDNAGQGVLTWRVQVPSDGWLSVNQDNGTVANTPVVIDVRLDRSKAPSGTPSTWLVVTGGSGEHRVLVRAVVANRSPVLRVEPTELAFGEASTSLVLTVANSGSGSLHWSVAAPSEGWITLSQREGTTTSEAARVDVRIDREKAPRGQAQATLVVTADGGARQEVRLSATVQRDSDLRVSPLSLVFGATSGRASFGVTSLASGTLTWQAHSSQPWISVSPDSGTTVGGAVSSQVVVMVDRSQLPPGEHTGNVDVTSSGGSATVLVTVSVPIPVLSLSARDFDFRSDLNVLNLSIANTGTGGLTWELAAAVPWLTVTPSRGVTGQVASSVAISVRRDGLAAGPYVGKVRLTSNSTSEPSVELTVRMQVAEQAVLAVLPDTLSFGTDTDELPLEIANSGNGNLSWQATSPDSWVHLAQSQGTAGLAERSTVLVGIMRAGLAAGSFASKVTVTSNGGSRTIPVRMAVLQAPRLWVGGQTIAFGTTSVEQLLALRNTGTGRLSWAITTDQAWCTAEPSQGTLLAETDTVRLVIDRSHLSVGVHPSTVTVGSDGGQQQVLVEVEVGNRAPTASGGPDQQVEIGAVVTLNGSGSIDADGDALTYRWTAPVGVTLSSETAVQPTFTTVTAGTYRFVLVVSDGRLSSAADEVVVTAGSPGPVNAAPLASAGPDQTVGVGTVVRLDGRGSRDADGDALSYVWRGPSGVVLSGTISSRPTFSASSPGTYAFVLTVSDGQATSAPDTVWVTVANQPPVSSAGANQTGYVGTTVTLDGSESRDPDGSSLSYRWTVPAGVSLSSATVVRPSFTPDRVGTYRFVLVVSDGELASPADTVVVTVANRAPTASAGPDQQAEVGAVVQLDGSGSRDPDGDGLTYQWRTAEGGVLSNARAVRPGFSASEAGVYHCALVVNDGQSDSAADTVAVFVGRTLVFAAQPGGSVSGRPLTTQPVVEARVGGVPDRAFTGVVALRLASGAGTLSGPLTVPAVAGVARFAGVTYTATTDGERFTLEASNPTARAVTSTAVVGSLGPAAQLTVELPGGATMEFVWIEPGTFTMGSPASEGGRDGDEGPQHQVTLTQGYYLGKYEITQGQWESAMGTRPWSHEKATQSSATDPAVFITWGDVQDLVSKLNQAAGKALFRLPSEAEWEYACRAGTSSRWSFGDAESQLGQYAWYGPWYPGNEYARSVGGRLANPWGLYDMHGNVAEWVQDWFGPYGNAAQADPRGPSAGSFRVARGGSFAFPQADTRSANRYSDAPGGRYMYIGARLLRTR